MVPKIFSQIWIWLPLTKTRPQGNWFCHKRLFLFFRETYLGRRVLINFDEFEARFFNQT